MLYSETNLHSVSSCCTILTFEQIGHLGKLVQFWSRSPTLSFAQRAWNTKSLRNRGKRERQKALRVLADCRWGTSGTRDIFLRHSDLPQLPTQTEGMDQFLAGNDPNLSNAIG